MKIPEEKIRQCSIALYGYLRKAALEDKDRAYLVTDKKTFTYGEAFAVVNGLAADLAARRIKKGDIVAVRAVRCPETVFISLAMSALGAVAVLTDPHFGVREYIAQSGVDIAPRYYISDETGEWRVEAGSGSEGAALSFRADGGAAEPTTDISPDDPFMVIFTSGSTGKSKAVVLSHKNCISNPADAMPLFEEDKNDVAISLLPLNHVFGFAVIACATFCGHPVVFPEDLSVDGILKTIQKYGVSVIYSVPTLFLDMLADGRHKSYDISSLRLGLMAGGPFTADQMRYIEGELGLRLMPGYGMSECVGVSTMRYRDGVEERAAGVGRLYPMTEAFILDENGAEVGIGAEGEICVRGMTLFLGYYNDEEATRAVVDSEGRLHTGDLGYMDGNGILHVSGRKKDIIIRGGENISAGKIENALLSLPDVYQAAVVGVKDDRFGEVPCAAVIPVRGCSPDESSLKKALAGALSGHEIPERIIVTDVFPKTSSGKTDKLKIKEMFAWKA
ncbi:MAG TPA: acyl--CoA ligase [Candidatus Protoclostridium stercorigallinarum]|uniref:Acyl--CoA ligase n=1 Tax=Candidatus Protoclostridium stercorigallinarum TaxID=2838741 RepID=A0A9D1Q0F2_9FIRM|nr:acyl--CoA ligase [Candidatus Protoclostridium stercorigallinarum]